MAKGFFSSSSTWVARCGTCEPRLSRYYDKNSDETSGCLLFAGERTSEPKAEGSCPTAYLCWLKGFRSILSMLFLGDPCLPQEAVTASFYFFGCCLCGGSTTANCILQLWMFLRIWPGDSWLLLPSGWGVLRPELPADGPQICYLPNSFLFVGVSLPTDCEHTMDSGDPHSPRARAAANVLPSLSGRASRPEPQCRSL